MLRVRLTGLILAAGLLGPACAGEPVEDAPCLGLTVDLALSSPLSADVRSFLVRTDGPAGPRRAVVDARIPAGQTRARLEAPGLAEGTDEVVVTGYAEPLIRGRLLVEGRADLEAGGGACARVEVALGPPAPRDGGTPVADGGLDAGVPDARDGGSDADPDVGPQDSGAGARCPSEVDEGTLAYFGVDGEVGAAGLDDRAGDLQATLRPPGATVAVTEGPPGCGDALSLFGEPYAVVEGSGALAPSAGSVDFWVRFEGDPKEPQGIISRDAQGQEKPGHLTIYRACDGHVVVRIQDELNSYYRCSDVTLEPGAWAHVGVNLGAPEVELWVNGVASTGTVAVGLWGEGCVTTVPCDQRVALDITGNQNPWVLGADTGVSVEDGAEPIRYPLRGALDEVRISARRRDFGR